MKEFVDILQGEVVAARCIYDLKYIERVRNHYFINYLDNDNMIGNLKESVNKFIKEGNYSEIEGFHKKLKSDMTKINQLPQKLKDIRASIQKKAMQEVHDYIETLKEFENEVKDKINYLKDIYEPLDEFRRDYFFENVSAPIINETIDEFMSLEKYSKVDLEKYVINSFETIPNILSLKSEYRKFFRSLSKTPNEIKEEANRLVYEVAESELIEVNKLIEDARSRQFYDMQLEILNNYLKETNKEHGVNIPNIEFIQALNMGIDINEIKLMILSSVDKYKRDDVIFNVSMKKDVVDIFKEFCEKNGIEIL